MTPIQNHQHYLAIGGNTYAGAGCPRVIVVSRCVDSNLTVANQVNATAHGFFDLIFIRRVVRRSANHSSSVVQNGKEVLAANAMVLYALHNQGTRWSTGAHVIEIGVHAYNRGEVLNIPVAGGVRIIGLSGSHLVGYAGHPPGGAIVILIVGIDADIISADVHGSSIEYDLLFIRSQRIGDVLLNAGGQGGILRVEHSVIGILGLRGLQLLFCQLKEIVGKSIAAGHAQITVIRQSPFSLQQPRTGILSVCRINCFTDALLGHRSGKTVCQEIDRPICIRERTCIIGFHQSAEGRATGKFAHEVETVQISIDVQVTEGMCVLVVYTEIGRADLLRHSLYICGRKFALAVVHQIADVSGPTAKVCGSLSVAVVVSDIHRTKHMGKFHRLTIRSLERANSTQSLSSRCVSGILLNYIGNKRSVL